MSKDSNKQNDTLIDDKTRVVKPSMYKVILINDDYTPMDFVINVLMGLFNKSLEEAEMITLRIHEKGSGTCGIYTHEVASSKVVQVMVSAKAEEYPLYCKMSKIG